MATRFALVAAFCVVASSCSRTCPTCEPGGVSSAPPYCGNATDETYERLRKVLAGSASPPKILMLSGGGSFGAWGAGVLNGWSARGNGGRPEFQLVTGSSTGAILGTWAFLGSKTDSSARCAYTNTRDRDVYEPALLSWLWLQPWRWNYARLPWVSLKNLGPLRDLFRRYTPIEQVEEVGRISREEGRVFLVATVDLDLGTFCTWDMGLLAENVLDAKDPGTRQEAYDRYMEVVMASSANPGIFNPTFIPPEIEGAMHVDGGVRHQLFLLPDVVDAVDDGLRSWIARQPRTATAPGTGSGSGGKGGCNAQDDGVPKIYAVLNLPMVVPRLCTSNNLYDIAQRSLTVLTIQSLISDVRWAKDRWESSGMGPGGKTADFCISQIPPERHVWKFADEFPECEMRTLYDEAFEQAKGSDPWQTELPPEAPSPKPCGSAPPAATPCRHPADDCGPGSIWHGGRPGSAP